MANRAGSPTRNAERASTADLPTGPSRAHLLPRTPRRLVPSSTSTPCTVTLRLPSSSASPQLARASRRVRPSSPLRRSPSRTEHAIAVEGACRARASLRLSMLRIEGARQGRRAPRQSRVRFAPAGRRAGPTGRLPPQAAHRLRRDARSRKGLAAWTRPSMARQPGRPRRSPLPGEPDPPRAHGFARQP